MKIIAFSIYPIAMKILAKYKAKVTHTTSLDGKIIYQIDIKDTEIRNMLRYDKILKIVMRDGSLLFLDAKEFLRGYITDSKLSKWKRR